MLQKLRTWRVGNVLFYVMQRKLSIANPKLHTSTAVVLKCSLNILKYLLNKY